ncbi:type II toxin-antitoxin system RelE/ParE family toxin [Peteryoungia ipomoeae]|uniref:Type II toxin-antitoxin system RelE/ParE family toxin n=1 Tax=Peteryoungia ipomoeae TaxID=1210932 RepID=A0A4V4HMR7_9HYPH|nr:type II toxin-antitoxin system RelE/ParE family toxin [Peteryoungia ipomoeae]THV23226.1 type II toxin-antitoxin system RelE/ParE family toxin [Peteryoungia ipomoeae]
MEIREFLDERGRSPFGLWFEALEPMAAVKVTTAITRMSLGNLSNAKGVGEGVLEYRIDYGPGYRIYFGRDGDRLIILLAGGTKKRQRADIEAAHARWAEYRKRKAG